MAEPLDRLLNNVRLCAICAAHLPFGPRPIVQMGREARVLVIGQAPGSKVHASGFPWRDESGARLRAWMGIDEETFTDARHIAMISMGFCYPGRGESGDLPPRPECAPLWHERCCLTCPSEGYAARRRARARLLSERPRKENLTETVRDFRRHLPGIFPLPHPSWRSTIWMRKDPWFEAEALPALREKIARALR